MINLPNPKNNPFLRESSPESPSPAMLADAVARIERKAARRSRLFTGASPAVPIRWFRPEPRASVQYAGHMATTAARDHRLTPQAKALLQVLRARCGNGNETATCKTTLAHIIGVCTRSVGRYIHDLIRFGYIVTRERRGAGGLTIGLAVIITEKVLPCFRKLPWLSGWLAQNLPANGTNSGRTELSYTNHSLKEFPLANGLRPPRTT
jgi:hypothetical protein